MASVAQRSFASGELDPALHAHTGLEAYGAGGKLIRNFLVGRNGGLMARAGFMFCQYLSATGITSMRLVDYVVDDDKNFLLVVTTGSSGIRVQVYKDGAGVSLTAANTFTVWATGPSFVVGDKRRVGNVVYRCILAHTAVFAEQGPTGAEGASYWAEIGTYSTDGTLLVVSATTTINAKELQFVRERDGVRIFHRNLDPVFIAYDGTSGGFGVRGIDFTEASASLIPPTIAVSGTAGTTGVGYIVTAAKFGAVTGSGGGFRIETESLRSNEVRTNTPTGSEGAIIAALELAPRAISWSAIVGADVYIVYRDTDSTGFRPIGMVLAGVTDFLDAGAATVVADGVPSGPPAESVAFSTNTTRAGVATTYQQRLILGGSVDEPDEVRGSRTAEPTNFSSSDPLVDDDEVTWRAYGVRVQRVVHMANLGLLLMLTTDGEWIVRGDTDGILRPAEVNPEQIGYTGSCRDVLPDILGTSLIYADYNATSVREVRRNGGQFELRELSVRSAHLLRDTRIVSISVQRAPDPIIWVVTVDGNLLACTYLPEEGVVAWTQHEIGRAELIDLSNPPAREFPVRDVRVVPTAAAPRRDAVYLVVSDGSSYMLLKQGVREPRRLESGENGGSPYTATYDYAPVDLGPLGEPTPRSTSGSAPNYRVEGLTQLAGREVSIVSRNGTGLTSVLTVVSDLALELPDDRRAVDGGGVLALTQAEYDAATFFYVGIPIISELETLDIDTANGRTMKESKMLVNRLGIWVRDAVSLWAGLEAPSLTANPDAESPLDGLAKAEVDAFVGAADYHGNRTGYIETNLLGRFNRSGRIYIRHMAPTPLTILAIAPQGLISQGG